MERIILAAGGTGGHIFPALAVSEEIMRRFPQARILFMGGSRGPEGRLAVKAGLEFMALPVRGVMRTGMSAPLGALRMVAGVFKAWAAMRCFEPQIVVGFGGYASFAPIAAAVLRGVPRALHEQNCLPGGANRLLARFAERVFLSFPDERGAFETAKTELTGNPVRRAIRLQAQSARKAGRNLLIVGGSQGAKAINSAVIDALDQLKSAGVSIRHQTGKADLEATQQAYVEAGYNDARVEAFIDDMAEAYAWADLVLCRAGATTMAELTAAGMPAVLVPFPYAAADHQTINAEQAQKAGWAVHIPQGELKAVDIAETVVGLLSDVVGLQAMTDAAMAVGKPDAAERIVDGLEKLVRESAMTKQREVR